MEKQDLLELEQKIRLLIEVKAYRNALSHLKLVLKYAPNRLDFRVMKAECSAFLGDYDQAAELIISLVMLDANSVNAIYLRGLCHSLQGNLDVAISHFERVLRIDPSHEKTKQMRRRTKALKDRKESGDALYKNGRYLQARAVYTDALRIDAFHRVTNSKLWFNRALANWKMGSFSEAIGDCTHVLEINCRHLNALLLRALCYDCVKKFLECIEDYKAALNVQDTPEIRKLLHEAECSLSTAKKPKRNNYYDLLGISRGASDYEIRKAYRQKALEHHPDRHVNSSADQRKQEESTFKKIGEAYAVLSDANKKQRYDRSLNI